MGSSACAGTSGKAQLCTGIAGSPTGCCSRWAAPTGALLTSPRLSRPLFWPRKAAPGWRQHLCLALSWAGGQGSPGPLVPAPQHRGAWHTALRPQCYPAAPGRLSSKRHRVSAPLPWSQALSEGNMLGTQWLMYPQ